MIGWCFNVSFPFIRNSFSNFRDFYFQFLVLLVYNIHNGTSNHGHRHSYGQRMKNAGIDKKVRQVAMHHKSEESQNVYTEPTVTEVTSALSQATSSLEQGMVLPMKTEIDSWYEEEKKITKKYIMGKK